MTTHMDHFEISTLISRFFRALDGRTFEEGWARALFTDDVRAVSPVGDAEGSAAIRQFEEAVGRFARTQHIATDVLVHVGPDSDAATASWNALMTHVHHDAVLRARGSGADPLFTVGGVYEAELRRTPDGWRISRMSVDAAWITGEPPALPEDVARRVAEVAPVAVA